MAGVGIEPPGAPRAGRVEEDGQDFSVRVLETRESVLIACAVEFRDVPDVVPSEVILCVLAKGDVKIIQSQRAWTIATEDEFVAVRSHKGTVFHRVGIDFRTEVLCQSPGIADARSMRNIDIEAPESSGTIRGKVETQTILCNKHKLFIAAAVDCRAEVDRCRPIRKCLPEKRKREH